MERRSLALICFIYAQLGLEEISAFNITHLNATKGLFIKTTKATTIESSAWYAKFSGMKSQTVIAAEMREIETTAHLISSAVHETVMPSLQKSESSSRNLISSIADKSSTNKQIVQSRSKLESSFSSSLSSSSSSSSSSSLYTISIKHHQNQMSSSIFIQATQVTSLPNIDLSCTKKTTDELYSITKRPSLTQMSASPANSTYFSNFSSILGDTNITISVVQIIGVSSTSFIKLAATITKEGKITPSLSLNLKHSPTETMNSSEAIKLKTSSSINLHPSDNISSVYGNKSHSSLKTVTSAIRSPQPSALLKNSVISVNTSSSTSKLIQDNSTMSLNTEYSSSVNFVNKISLQPTRYKTKFIVAASSTVMPSSLGANAKTVSLSFDMSTEIFKLIPTSMVTPLITQAVDGRTTSSIHPTKVATTDGNIDLKKKKQENKGLPAWIAILSAIAVFIAIMTIVVVTFKYIRWNKDHGDYTLWISNLELQPITSRNAEVLT